MVVLIELWVLYCQESTVIGFKVSDKGPTVVLSVWAPQVLKGPQSLLQGRLKSTRKCSKADNLWESLSVRSQEVSRLPYKWRQMSTRPSLTVFARITTKTLTFTTWRLAARGSSTCLRKRSELIANGWTGSDMMWQCLPDMRRSRHLEAFPNDRLSCVEASPRLAYPGRPHLCVGEWIWSWWTHIFP